MIAPEPLTILVVDDNEAGRYVKAKTLRQAGYHVVEAGDGSSGIEMVQANDVSLVVLDVHLPDMLGFEVCRRLKALQPSLPVLMTSATYIATKDRSFGLDEGADAYLTEPLEEPVLLSQIRALHRMRAAERKQRESEARLQLALEASNGAAWHWDLETDSVEVSAGYRQLYGFSAHERITYEHWLAQIDARDREAVRADCDRLRATGGDFAVEFRIAHPEHGERWLMGRGRVDCSIGGKPVKFVGINRDITDRKSVEDRVARELDALSRLHRIGTLFVREGGLEPVLKEIVEAAIAITGADCGTIQLVDPDTGILRIAAHVGLPDWWIKFWNAEAERNGTCGTTYRNQERICVEDVENSPHFSGAGLDTQRRAGLRALQSTPLLGRSGEPVGAFSTHYRSRRVPDERELRLLDLLARQASDIIERAGAEASLRERNRQLDVIAKVSGQLLVESPSSVNAITGIAHIIADELGFEQFFYFTADEQARVLELEGALGLEEGQRALFSRIRFGEYLCGLVAERRERLIVNDLPSARYPEAELLLKAGVTFYAGFPLLAEGRLIGTLAFATRRRSQPKAGEILLLQTFSDQAAVQLARSLGEQRLRESEERLRFAYDIAGIAAWDVDLLNNVSVWSPKLFDMLGIEHGRPACPELLFDHVLPEDLPGLRQAYTEGIAQRTTFNHEFRIRRPDGEVRHLIGVGRVVAEAEGRPSRMIGINYDDTERKKAEEQIRLLSREVSHRSKNMLGLVQAIARQTASGDPTDFLDRFSSRLHSLAAAQDLLVNDAWQGVQLDALVRSQLAHFADLIGDRITIAGPPVRLPPPAAQAIGMALHELGTNAAKYGALSTVRGRIEIMWSIAAEPDSFKMSWREIGGPPVSLPAKKGFGTTVIEKMVSASLRGVADLRFAATGLEWSLVCAATDLLGDQVSALGVTAPIIGSGSRRVLLVEDEPVVAHDLASILEAANFTVVGPAASVTEALAHLELHDCEAGVLDIHLRNETSEAIAETLSQRSIPFVVVSGYLVNQQPQIFNQAPRVPKPVSATSLVATLNELLRAS